MKDLEYYMNLEYPVEIVPDYVEGGYAAQYPDLPGCITTSDTLEGVAANAEDAKKEWLQAALEDGYKIKEPVEEMDVSE